MSPRDKNIMTKNVTLSIKIIYKNIANTSGTSSTPINDDNENCHLQNNIKNKNKKNLSCSLDQLIIS